MYNTITHHTAKMSQQYIEKGNSLIADAERELNRWFANSTKYADVAEKYAEAAIQFKLANSFDECAKCHVSAAGCYTIAEERFHAADQYASAGIISINSNNLTNIKKYLPHAIKLYLDMDKFTRAIKLCETLGNVYYDANKLQEAADCFKQAHNLCTITTLHTRARIRILKRHANILITLQQYTNALKNYTIILKDSFKTKSPKSPILTTVLLKLITHESLYNIQTDLETYIDKHPSFEYSRSQLFITKLLQTYFDQNTEEFNKLIDETTLLLSDPKKKLLNALKDSMDNIFNTPSLDTDSESSSPNFN